MFENDQQHRVTAPLTCSALKGLKEFPKADYHIHNTLSVDLNVSHMNQGHTVTPLFYMILEHYM